VDYQNVGDVLTRDKELEHTVGGTEHSKATRTREQQAMQRVLNEKAIKTSFAGRGSYPYRRHGRRRSEQVWDHHIVVISKQQVLKVDVGGGRQHGGAALTSGGTGSTRSSRNEQLRLTRGDEGRRQGRLGRWGWRG